MMRKEIRYHKKESAEVVIKHNGDGFLAAFKVKVIYPLSGVITIPAPLGSDFYSNMKNLGLRPRSEFIGFAV